ncbi:MAG: outer membrane protein assembly factor BamA [bacterium]
MLKRGLSATTILLVFLLAAGWLTGESAFAQQQAYRVTDIEVVGNESVQTSLILQVSGLRQDMLVSSTAIQEAIRRVYGLELFADVAIEGEFAGGGVKLRIEVKEHPKLKDLKIEGNKKIKVKDIEPKLTVFVNQVVTPNQIQSNAQRIKDLYSEEGYHQAEVTGRVDSLAEGGVSLTYKIVEHEKVKIRDIVVTGTQAFSPGKVRGQMDHKPKGFLRSGSFEPEKYERDKDKIIEFYRKEGYLDAGINADSVVVDPDGKRMVIYIDVFEGQRYYFGETTFSGFGILNEEFLRKQLKYEPGDIYNSEKYQETIENLYGVYYEEGHIHARVFDQTQTVDSTLNVSFEINEGTPAKINKVIIAGNYKTKEKVIRRELYSQPGQIFRRSLLMRSLRNAMYLNYFSNVEPEMEQLPNGDVNLLLNVEEKQTGQVQAGAGYSDYDKLVGTVGLGIPNFRGNGQTLKLDWSFGSRRNSVSVSFTEPWLLDTPTSVGIDLYNVNRQYVLTDGEFTENSRGAGLRVGRRLRWPDDYFRVLWQYGIKEERLYDFSDAYRENHADDPNSLVQYENEFNTTSSTGFTLTRDSRDLSQFATSGSVLSYGIEYAGGPLGGDWKYHKHIFEASKFTTVWWKIVLATKVRVGLIDSPDGDASIPYTERFAPGGTYGDGTIRGYDDRSVGPISEGGAYLRGRSLLIYNLELQVPLVEQQIYGLLFADAGNAWLTGKAVRPFDLDRWDGLKKSLGVGFRLQVPGLGIIGFDFAYGYNNPDGAGWKPHFQIGSTF